MEAFKIPNPLKDLVECYPDAKKIQRIVKEGGENARLAIARLWLSEGIPFAFKNSPGIYEALRSWVAIRLSIDPKDISITGSARIGQSLSPQKIGKLFDANSDLDIFVVSDDLFEKLKDDFNQWTYDFEVGDIKPTNDRQLSFWKDNYVRGSKLLARGFMDSKLIPNCEKYKTAKNIAQTMWLVKEKLSITPDAPAISQASVRCYRSWNDFAKQVSLNLKELAK